MQFSRYLTIAAIPLLTLTTSTLIFTMKTYAATPAEFAEIFQFVEKVALKSGEVAERTIVKDENLWLRLRNSLNTPEDLENLEIFRNRAYMHAPEPQNRWVRTLAIESGTNPEEAMTAFALAKKAGPELELQSGLVARSKVLGGLLDQLKSVARGNFANMKDPLQITSRIEGQVAQIEAHLGKAVATEFQHAGNYADPLLSKQAQKIWAKTYVEGLEVVAKQFGDLPANLKGHTFPYHERLRAYFEQRFGLLSRSPQLSQADRAFYAALNKEPGKIDKMLEIMERYRAHPPGPAQELDGLILAKARNEARRGLQQEIWGRLQAEAAKLGGAGGGGHSFSGGGSGRAF